jgi:DNA mismatch repair ATPase MutS
VLSRAVERLQVLVQPLRDLRQFADEHEETFRSAGMRDLVGTIRENLSDEYFATFQDHLNRLRFPTGVVMTARLGQAAKNADVVLRKPVDIRRTWRDWLGLPRHGEFTYTLPDRDEAGAQAMSELKDRGLNRVADAAARSADHIISFYGALRWEVAFYLGCLALHDSLSARGMPTCMPDPRAPQEICLNARDLYDPTLVLATKAPVVGNDLDADARSIIVITGANQGGKSTLLRSIGLAQVCMQAGVFVAATRYVASLSPTIHTHFTREEDSSMESGKLDEELRRMSAIADRVGAGDLVLFNESFACTNEREGSSIARVVIDALDEAGVRIAFVTHMFDLAHGLAEEGGPQVLFLRPERLDDGRRTFKLVPGEPLPTSHGHDLYEKVFGATAST